MKARDAVLTSFSMLGLLNSWLPTKNFEPILGEFRKAHDEWTRTKTSDSATELKETIASYTRYIDNAIKRKTEALSLLREEDDYKFADVLLTLFDWKPVYPKQGVIDNRDYINIDSYKSKSYETNYRVLAYEAQCITSKDMAAVYRLKVIYKSIRAIHQVMNHDNWELIIADIRSKGREGKDRPFR